VLDSVEASLLPLRENWDDITAPTDPELIEAMLTWAWEQSDMKEAVSAAYRNAVPTREAFAETVTGWLEGKSLVEMANAARLDTDVMLGVHARVLTYVLQVAIEQAIGLLRKLLDESEKELAPAVINFPEHLRFGVPTSAARVIAAGGVRHRRAAIALGWSPELSAVAADDQALIFATARRLLEDRDRWLPKLGSLVLEHTIEDLSEATPAHEVR
jgi:hypothetical protein